MSNRTRLTPDQRQLQILNAAIDIALDRGLYGISVANVARGLCGCSKPTVRHYFPNLTALRTEVINAAIERDHRCIVAQAITMRDDAVDHLTKEQRRGYLKDV